MRCCSAAKLGRPVLVEGDDLAVEDGAVRAQRAVEPAQLGILRR